MRAHLYFLMVILTLLAPVAGAQPRTAQTAAQAVCIRDLREAAVAERIEAAGCLASHPSPQAVEALIAALKDSSALVRRAAVEALARGKDPRIADALAGVLGDDSVDVRAKATVALVGLGDSRAVSALLDMAAAGPRADILDAALTLQNASESDKLQLIAALGSSRSALRATAAAALGALREARALDALLELTRSRDLESQLAAVLALGKIGDPAALPTVRQILESPNPDSRRAAALGLAGFADASALEPLLATALRDPEERVRFAAVQGLQRFRENPKTRPEIERALVDTRPEARRSAAAALWALYAKEPASVQKLEAALQKKDLPVIAGAYGFFLPRKGASPFLREALAAHGTAGMAAALADSGDDDLRVEGTNWLRIHGYRILGEPVPVSRRARSR